MNHPLRSIPTIATLFVAAFAVTNLPLALAQEHEHDHDHAAETEGADAHADHEHARDGAHDHDHHEDEALRIDPDTMREFGIVLDQAGPGSVAQILRLPGEVVFNADRIAHVAPSVSGIVLRVHASVGDRVNAGDVLAVLSSRELAAARSGYLAAQAQLELTQEVLEREERLLTDRIGTERQVLEARQAVREAQIALNLAEQNLHALGQSHAEIDELREADDASFSHYPLRAPLSGVVIARHLTRGEVVSEQPEQAPFVVADLSSVWVNLTVYQRDLAAVRPGAPVRIEFGHGLPDATGVIAFVSPALDETTRTATARVVLDNPDGQWRPGLFVTGRLATEQEASAVVVPRSGVATLDGQTVVFVQTAEGFEPRPVRLGRTDETHAEIVSGLEPGETYVSRGTLSLKAEMNRAALEHAGHAH